jgi:hypothetical protein
VEYEVRRSGKRVVAASLALFAAIAACGARAEDAAPNGFPSLKTAKDHLCFPKDNTVRILKSANPLDYAPNWSKTNAVGTAWWFAPKRYVVTEIQGGVFLQGDLTSPRGGVTDRDVFILAKEWDCGSP